MTGEQTRQALARFYEALARRDAATMAAAYAPDAAFDDPVFQLRGPTSAGCGSRFSAAPASSRSTGRSARAEPDRGEVAWTARYLFGGKRPVVNVIESDVRFRDGQIVEQTDRFDFPRWAAQALGPPGRLLGGFEWFRRSVARKARRGIGLSHPGGPGLPHGHPGARASG